MEATRGDAADDHLTGLAKWLEQGKAYFGREELETLRRRAVAQIIQRQQKLADALATLAETADHAPGATTLAPTTVRSDLPSAAESVQEMLRGRPGMTSSDLISTAAKAFPHVTLEQIHHAISRLVKNGRLTRQGPKGRYRYFNAEAPAPSL